MKQTFSEQFAFQPGTIGGTPDAPIVHGVLLCGPVSHNKRRYLKKAFEGTRVEKYNGAAVNLNHGQDSRTGRPYQEQIGIVKDARLNIDGMPIGDIHVNPKKPYAEAFLWDAKNNPKACSMSHVAECDFKQANDGWIEVIEILNVESVDVISANNAATTNSLFENRNKRKGRVMPYLTVKQLAECLVKHPKIKSGQVSILKELAEMDGMDTVQTGMEQGPVDDADPADPVQDAFKTAIAHLVDQCKCFGGTKTDEECLKSIRELLRSHGKMNGTVKSEPEKKEEPEVEEGKRRADPIIVLQECQNAGYQPGASVLKALALMTPDERKAFVEENKGTVIQPSRPTGASRRPAAPTPVQPSNQTQSAPGKIKKWDEM